MEKTNSFLKLAIAYFAATAANRHHLYNPQASTIVAGIFRDSCRQ